MTQEEKLLSESDSTNIPYGYCHCGCGEKTRLARQTVIAYGHVKGEPLRFILGHANRSNPDDHYVVEDHGFDTPCWVWQLGKNKHGYGSLSRKGSSSTTAHRVYYEQRFGPIQAGFDLHHLCKRKTCVNPDHLQAVPHGQHSSLHARTERAKLNMDKAAAIRRLYATSSVSYNALARQFDVSPALIRWVVANKAWKT